MQNIRFGVDTSLKWFVIWILMIVGDPDIIDGIVQLLLELAQFLAR